MDIAFPPPAAFGLPARFPHWRPDQIEAAQVILDASTRFVGLTMPTGSGKGLAYMAALGIGGGRGVVLTSTKGLQDQLRDDFGPLVFDVRGQRNYPCKALGKDGDLADLWHGDGEATCEEGPCHAGVVCGLKEAGCWYYDRLRQATGQRIISTNYAAWLAQRRYGQGLGGSPDLLVLDEAHDAVDQLAESMTITLEKWLVKAVGIDSVPDEHGPLQTWKDWAAFQSLRAKSKLETLGKPVSWGDLKYRRRLRAFLRVMEGLATMDWHNWVGDHTDQAWVWSVVHPAQYAEQYLFQGAKKVVLLSATLTAKTLALLGIEDATMWECPSRFPIERRPVIYVPTVKVDFKMTPDHWTAWKNRVDQIIGPRQDRKGIIHTVSYKRRDAVVAQSQYKDLLVTHQSSDLVAQVGRFRKNPKPQWLVSPSIMTGWDFPYDQCRCQIIAKLPFPDTRSKILKARCEVDADYMPYLTMQALVQAVGRGMRAPDDWCETFIIDDHWKWFGAKYRRLAPKWFLEAVRMSLALPPPLKL